MNLLLAYDGSPNAARAAQEAARLAGALKASVQIAYVVPPLLPMVNEYAVTDFGEIEVHRLAQGVALVEAQAAVLRRQGLEVTTTVEEGPPAERLTHLAAAEDVGYVVIGASGHGIVARAFLGSVVFRLLHLCPKPLVVVR